MCAGWATGLPGTKQHGEMHGGRVPNGGVLTAALVSGRKRGLLFPERELGEGGGRALLSRCQAGFEEQRDKSWEVGGLNPSPHFLLLSVSRCSWGSCLALPIAFPHFRRTGKAGRGDEENYLSAEGGELQAGN